MPKPVLRNTQGEKKNSVLSAEKGAGKAAMTDEELNEKRKDRSYNPIDDAEKGSVSGKLNEDAARYRKGPGPL